MKKLLAVFLVFCFCLFVLLGCKEETIAEPRLIDAPALTAEESQPETTELKVKMAACGFEHSVALCDDGTVWGWGKEFYESKNSSKPVQIPGLSDITYVAAGDRVSAAIKSDGTLWMWGLGWTSSEGVMYGYPLTLSDPYMTDVKEISFGAYFTAVLKNDGTVWLWGEDNSDDWEAQKIPKKVEGLPKIKKIAASWYHVAFLDEDGHVWYIEQEYMLPWKPKLLTEVTNVTSIAGGGHHFVILKDDGTVYTFSALFDITHFETFSDVAELTDVVDIAGGGFYSVAVKKDGTVWSWGYSEYGLGDGVNTNSELPVQVANITDATGIASGNIHVLVTTPDGLYAWGDNSKGQLGYGVKPADPNDTSTNRSTPVRISFVGNLYDDTSSDAESKLPETSAVSSEAVSFATSSATKPAESSQTDNKSNTTSYYPLPNRGFTSNSWDVLYEKIRWDDLDVQNWGNPDPSEYLPLYAPFLKMDKDTLVYILKTAKNFNWEDYQGYINAFERRACEITVICEDYVITYLQFGVYYDGRYYAYSMYDNKVAFISEEEYLKIKELFEAAPEWPEKYYERFGYHHYSEYPRDNTVSY